MCGRAYITDDLYSLSLMSIDENDYCPECDELWDDCTCDEDEAEE